MAKRVTIGRLMKKAIDWFAQVYPHPAEIRGIMVLDGEGTPDGHWDFALFRIVYVSCQGEKADTTTIGVKAEDVQKS